MQKDGNFVLYDDKQYPKWSTGTEGHLKAYLEMQVIFDC
jgi:hypothetical protein